MIDGIVYAGMVGLGFAMTENILYYGKGCHLTKHRTVVCVHSPRGTGTLLSSHVHQLYGYRVGTGPPIAKHRGEMDCAAARVAGGNFNAQHLERFGSYLWWRSIYSDLRPHHDSGILYHAGGDRVGAAPRGQIVREHLAADFRADC